MTSLAVQRCKGPSRTRGGLRLVVSNTAAVYVLASNGHTQTSLGAVSVHAMGGSSYGEYTLPQDVGMETTAFPSASGFKQWTVKQPWERAPTWDDTCTGDSCFTPLAELTADLIQAAVAQPPVPQSQTHHVYQGEHMDQVNNPIVVNGALAAQHPPGVGAALLSTLRFVIVDFPVHGKVAVNATTGRFTYTAAAAVHSAEHDYRKATMRWYGADSFTFHVTDATGLISPSVGTVHISQGRNPSRATSHERFSVPWPDDGVDCTGAAGPADQAITDVFIGDNILFRPGDRQVPQHA